MPPDMSKASPAEKALRAQRIAEREAQKKVRLRERKEKKRLEASGAAPAPQLVAAPAAAQKRKADDPAAAADEPAAANEAAPQPKKKKVKAAPADAADEAAPAGDATAQADAPPKKKKEKKEKKAPADAPRADAGKGKGKGGASSPAAKGGKGTPSKKAPYSGPLSPPYEVFLKFLPPDATEAQVEKFFDGCGALCPPGPKLMREHSSGRVIRGFVKFETEAGIRAALLRDLNELGKRSVSVTCATTSGTLQEVGTHTPAMFGECVEALGLWQEPNGTYVDGTFGRGGHTRKILAALGPRGTLHAFDMDPEAVAAGKILEGEDSRFVMHHAPFSHMVAELRKRPQQGAAQQAGKKSLSLNFEGDVTAKPMVTGVLLDIGISSPQLDGGRGFKPEVDAPLDMRFDVSEGVESAIEFVLRVGRAELARALELYGGEHPLAARRIADAVELAKQSGELTKNTRTKPFAALVAAAKGKEYQAMHPAKLTFQALRIAVNREFDELRDGLAASVSALKPGGRVAILTWKHSECAIIVDFQRKNECASADAPLRKWYADHYKSKALPTLEARAGLFVEDARRPTQKEVLENSRSRSAVLHILRKTVGVRLEDLETVVRDSLDWAPYDVVSRPEEQPTENGPKKAKKRKKQPVE